MLVNRSSLAILRRALLIAAAGALSIGLGVGDAASAATPEPDSPATVSPALISPAQASPALTLAVVVPITVPESTDALIPANELAAYTAPFGRLTRQLDAVAGRAVSLAIDPRIIVSVRVLGSEAPPSAVQWLSRLDAADNDTFALAYGDADVTLATQAGAPSAPIPDGFDFAINPSHFSTPVPPQVDDTPPPETPAVESDTTGGSSTPAPSGSPSASSDPTGPPADPGDPPLPTGADLLSWPYTVDGLAWPRNDTVVAADITKIVEGGASTILINSGNLASGAATAETSATVDGTRALVSNDTVSSALDAVALAATSSSAQKATSALAATVTAVAQARAGSEGPVLATVERSTAIDAGHLSEAIAALDADPTVTLVGLGSATGKNPVAATVKDRPQPAERTAAVTRLLEARAAEEQFLVIAEAPQLITSSRTLSLLMLLSNSWSARLAEWAPAVQGDLEASRTLTTSVELVASGDLNFFASAAELPISVRNDLSQAVTVVVTVRPDTGQLTVADSGVEVTIPANSQSSARVSAQAVSNGLVAISISLSDTSGSPIGDTERSRINVQAGWETPVIVVAAVILIGLFGGGLARNIIRLRRRSAAGRSEAAEGPEEGQR